MRARREHSSSPFSRSCGPPPHHPTDLYISRRVSHFRHYHSCRGGVRARYTRPLSFLPSSRGGRKPRFVFRACTHLRISSCVATLRHLHVVEFNKVVQFLSCLISSSKGRLNCCGCVYFRNETGDVQPFFPRGIARGLRDMCATWAETEGPPAAPAE